ncbi:polymorphic toxin-type HINT domain-containing protein [Streptomyces sp. NPDC050509]|uniref:polymorphic toxin-type HINT domain-containing protein n=1 Tax=Streptomyces sp. NPDC050509 TaxID=3365620 RepID=UPI00379A3FEE
MFAYGSGRQPLPRPLQVALILVRVLFGLTVLGGVGALMTAASVDEVDGQLLGLLAYAAAPGVVGLLLTRWAWTGGARVRWGLLAVQGWLLVGALQTLGDGGGRGLTQLMLPVVIIVLLCRRPSREWFLLAPLDRAEHRPFRLARMIKWRTDGGQTAAEYLGLVVVVVAIIGGLVATGVGGRITDGLQSAVCELSGSACPTSTSGGESGDADVNTEAGGPGASADEPGAGDVTTAEDEVKGEGEKGGGSKGGDQEKKEDGDDCSGWGFFSCGVKQVGGFFKGAAVDGFWGDVTGTFDTIMHPLDALDGLKEYGKGLGVQWNKDSQDAGDKWDKGNYLGAVWDWGKASGKTGVKVVDDVFVGDEVRDMWDKGDYGRAVGTVGWNVGSLFIPGYGEAKLIGRIGKLGKDAKKAADKASDAKRKPDAEEPKKPDKELDACPVSHSFLPGTPVLMADGSRRAIEDVYVGDKVIATDPLTGVTAERPVTRTFTTRDDKDFTVLTVRTRSRVHQLVATDTHPFWLSDRRRWADAGEVRVGDQLRTSAGVSIQVAAVSRYVQRRTTYDLAVAGIHTYYVGIGSANVLVHNNNGCEWQARDDISGPAKGLVLKRPNDRHYLRGVAHQKKPQAAKNTVILRGYEKQIDADIKAIAEGKAKLLKDGNRYEVDGRTYGVEDTGRVYPESGPGMVEMDTHEYAALIEVAKYKGDVDASPQLKRNPRFTNHPERVAKAKAIYEGTYK